MVFTGSNLSASSADGCDVAQRSVHADEIADLDRPFGKQNQAADEVVQNVLATEADTDCHRPAEEGENSQRHIGVAKGGQSERDQQGVEGQRFDGVRSCFFDAPFGQATPKQCAEPASEHEANEEQQHAAADLADGE